MAGVNKVTIIGNLGRDPELRHTQGGVAVCRMNVATTRSWTNKDTHQKQEETEWHRITVWGKQGEHCQQYLEKGRQVYIEGRLKTSSYEDNGVKKYSTDIIAEVVQFLGSKPASSGGGQGGGRSGGGGNAQGSGEHWRGPAGPEGSDDDIPF